MFLLDWFYGALASLGLRQKLDRSFFLGLDNADKTKLLRLLKDEITIRGAKYPSGCYLIYRTSLLTRKIEIQHEMLRKKKVTWERLEMIPLMSTNLDSNDGH